MSYQKLIENSSTTNKIGNFASFSVGSGNSILKATQGYMYSGASNPSSAPFKVNLSTGELTATNATITGTITATSGSFTGEVIATSGSFTGAITATSGTFRGTIYAEAGAIEGDLAVSGSLLSDNAGFQVKITSGKTSYLKSGVEKGYIRVPSGSNGLQIASGENIYLTKEDGSNIIQIGQDGSFRFSSDSGYFRWGSGRSIYANSSTVKVDGHFAPHADITDDLGIDGNRWRTIRGRWISAADYYSCAGNNGISHAGYGFVRRVDHDGGGHVTDVKYVELRLNGGIITRLTD